MTNPDACLADIEPDSSIHQRYQDQLLALKRAKAKVGKISGCDAHVCVCVCVFSQRSSIGDIRRVLLQGTGHTYHNRAYAHLFRVLKTMQNALSIDPRGTLVIYNAPARFTY